MSVFELNIPSEWFDTYSCIISDADADTDTMMYEMINQSTRVLRCSNRGLYVSAYKFQREIVQSFEPAASVTLDTSSVIIPKSTE